MWIELRRVSSSLNRDQAAFGSEWFAIWKELEKVSVGASDDLSMLGMLKSPSFRYSIQFKGTKSHGNADGLTRLPRAQCAKQINGYEVDGTFALASEQFDALPVTCKEVRQTTAKDPVLSRVYDMVMNGWPRDDDATEVAAFRNRRNELSVHQGCLLWGLRFVLPEKLRKRVLYESHEGHLGIVKMSAVSRSFVLWPGIDADLENLAKQCEGCQLYKASPSASPVHPWEWSQRHWQRVHADFA
ncbi:uncharacterized protein K02A2.6-like [Dreissena polymorpha]|uniref:uncharacterized protein K02A2.6-like n=1 Tax=Dreissena polymorpha TaxID=45954 RepID=UPI002263FED8|nr:uncharacterized protein K02A2.6-like [Dreissena polymorpha]